jgi:hypothetical protein
MPVLAPAVPLLGGAGATGGTVATGGTILGGITATQMAVAGAVLVTGVAVIAIADDYLDRPATQSETDGILSQAGAPSKEARRRLADCRSCVWCQINIQAQGNFLPLRNRTDPQGIGPYLVQNRTVTTREGVIVAGAIHAFAQGLASRCDFRQIESWDMLGRTVQFILSRPPRGPAQRRASRRRAGEVFIIRAV